jgi:hypothetical protein
MFIFIYFVWLFDCLFGAVFIYASSAPASGICLFVCLFSDVFLFVLYFIYIIYLLCRVREWLDLFGLCIILFFILLLPLQV